MASLLYRLGSTAARRPLAFVLAWVLVLGTVVGAMLSRTSDRTADTRNGTAAAAPISADRLRLNHPVSTSPSKHAQPRPPTVFTSSSRRDPPTCRRRVTGR